MALGLRRLSFPTRRILDLSDGITGTALAETGTVWEQACKSLCTGLESCGEKYLKKIKMTAHEVYSILKHMYSATYFENNIRGADSMAGVRV